MRRWYGDTAVVSLQRRFGSCYHPLFNALSSLLWEYNSCSIVVIVLQDTRDDMSRESERGGQGVEEELRSGIDAFVHKAEGSCVLDSEMNN